MIEIHPGLEFASYVLEAEIGHGGMGVVYKAHEPLLGRYVALKLIRTEIADSELMRQRFMIEARAGAAIDHPNVVQVHMVGQVEDILFIAMQLIDGPSLGDVLDKEAYLDPTRAVTVVSQIAGALEVAHERGLVHRDVKPRNILLQKLGGAEHAYLADFGLARFIGASGLTRSGDSIGTPAYMAPEQVSGAVVDGRADVYALGCVLHQALTGEEPFPRPLAHEVYAAHLYADPPLASSCNSSVSPHFDPVIRLALAKAPEDRYPSCAELDQACREALGLALGEAPSESLVRELEITIPEAVLVRQEGEGRALIHRTGACPVLGGSVVPPHTIRFGGPGTAGWLPFAEAAGRSDVALCGVCIARDA